MAWFFLFFLISGFCSILYELVWLRLSMAAFGVTTALTSIVLSVFMAGLGLGSWGSGRILRRLQTRLQISPLLPYAALEFMIGLSALLVPAQLHWGRILTEHLSLSASSSFYLASAVCITAALLPWCACMGATIPLGMFAIRSARKTDSERSFSYLYLANLTGALLGTFVPLLLIEMRGFRGTLHIGAALNFLLAGSAVLLARFWHPSTVAAKDKTSPPTEVHTRDLSGDRNILLLLFGTGLTCMGMEVVWIRQFTPFLGTMVYAFAAILGIYLCATTIGAKFYRIWSRRHSHEAAWLWTLLGLCAVFPLFTTSPALTWWPMVEATGVSPRLSLAPGLRLLIGIGPFSGLLGFLTPLLVDRWSQGDSDRAGSAYAINVVGCIVGPLISGFVLLPIIAERFTLFLLAVPWLAIGIWKSHTSPGGRAKVPVWSYGMALAAVVLLAMSHGYEDRFPDSRVLRDNTATVIAADSDDGKRLLVNGIGMTALTPITKMMAHLPLASLDRPPQNALVICFGMGTTFRSLLSWNIRATAAELVPSVPRLFGFFHPDGPMLLQSPNARVVVDDGRRYLERIPEQYDVIAIDPPPPVEAAGSSLLYTKEFYATIRQRLRPGGILQQWFPDEENEFVLSAVTKALQESFPYVRAFSSMEGWGVHFLASDRPLPRQPPEQLLSRMPSQAVADMMEWHTFKDPAAQFAAILDHEFTLESLIDSAPEAPTLVDDRPVNEYYLLRRQKWLQAGTTARKKDVGRLVASKSRVR